MPGSAIAPVWSPDGRSIAFLGVSGDRQEVWVIPSDGSSPARQLTSGANASRFRWDGESGAIFVSGKWGGESMTLCRIPETGGKPEPSITFGAQSSYGLFDISRKLLVYTRERKTGDIWILEAVGGSF
jgi:Tol biopolymer transport system component